MSERPSERSRKWIRGEATRGATRHACTHGSLVAFQSSNGQKKKERRWSDGRMRNMTPSSSSASMPCWRLNVIRRDVGEDRAGPNGEKKHKEHPEDSVVVDIAHPHEGVPPRDHAIPWSNPSPPCLGTVILPWRRMTSCKAQLRPLPAYQIRPIRKQHPSPRCLVISVSFRPPSTW